MGVERQTAKVNWLTSLGMIVMAGTFYRVRKLTKNLSGIQIKDLLIRYGLMGEPPAHKIIVGRPLKNQVGEWQSIQQSRKRYKLNSTLYNLLQKTSNKP